MKLIHWWYFSLVMSIILGNIIGTLMPGLFFSTNFLTVQTRSITDTDWIEYSRERGRLITGSLMTYLAGFFFILTILVQLIIALMTRLRDNQRLINNLFPDKNKKIYRKDIQHGLGIEDKVLLGIVNDQKEGYSYREVIKIIRSVKKLESAAGK